MGAARKVKIKCLTDGTERVYNSIKEAEKQIGISSSQIYQAWMFEWPLHKKYWVEMEE